MSTFQMSRCLVDPKPVADLRRLEVVLFVNPNKHESKRSPNPSVADGYDQPKGGREFRSNSGPVNLTVQPASHGRRLVRFLLESLPEINARVIYKALERRDVRINGQRMRRDATLAAGDQISIFLPAAPESTDPLAGSPKSSSPDSGHEIRYRLLQQVGGILVILKLPGLAVQPGQDLSDGDDTLISLLRRDYEQPDIALCHRIDRQTGGLLLAAANADLAARVRRLMQDHHIHKRYRCLVRGIPADGTVVDTFDGTPMKELVAWHEKDAARSDVYIHDFKQPGDVPVVTRYRVVQIFSGAGPEREAVAELEVELVTGRTHQIRAHFAHLGHPLLGDGKYGRNAYNRYFRTPAGGMLKRQQLWATSISFDPDCPSPCTALAGSTVSIDPAYDVVLTGQADS